MTSRKSPLLQGLDGFQRQAVRKGENVVIQSICEICGFRIVSSVSEGLEEDEINHRAKCKPTVIPVRQQPDVRSLGTRR